MISASEYKDIEPHREDIRKFQSTKRMRNHQAVVLTDKIRQRHGMGAINYVCEGCKIQALIEIWNMIIEYEQNFTPNI